MNQIELSKHYLETSENVLTKTDIETLASLLEYHSDLYYNKENPVLSDFEYDMLFKKLQFLEEKFHIWEKNTHKVWSTITQSTFAKVKHSRPMISLDNTYNDWELRDFDERVKKNIKRWIDELSYTLEFKFDGLWVELIYKNGELFQAITRWNGVEGEDITQNVLTVQNIPKHIPYFHHLEVRGEVVMPISSFEALNSEAKKTWEKIFSNPRNAASGSLRLKDVSVTATRNLKFFAYDLANFEEFRLKEEKQTYYDVIKDLEDFWFEISSFFPKCSDIEEVISQIENLWNIKSTLDFEIDGLVIKVNNISLWQEIGFTAHHPRYAIAYKFPAEILTTKILSVDHQIGRTGTLTPVANLEPVFITWVTVKRATLHNYDEIQNLWVKIWDTIFIKRAWEVIPKIISVIEEARDWNEVFIEIPTHCPSCQTQIKKDDNKVRYYCPNYDYCPEQGKQKLIHAVWKNGLDIDGLGSEQIDLFLEKWWIQDVWDIFTLENKKELILSEPWYKEKSVNNLLSSIEKAKHQDIVSFLVALNIPWIWKQSAKELSKFLKHTDDLIYFSFNLEDLIAMNDIGEGTAKNIYEFFTSQHHQQFLKKLLSFITLTFREEVEGGIFNGAKMCITGSFENYSRDQLIEILEKNGWAFVSSVSVKTDFLLAWEKAGSKLKKATELGIEILNIEEFFEKIKK